MADDERIDTIVCQCIDVFFKASELFNGTKELYNDVVELSNRRNEIFKEHIHKIGACIQLLDQLYQDIKEKRHTIEHITDYTEACTYQCLIKTGLVAFNELASYVRQQNRIVLMDIISVWTM